MPSYTYEVVSLLPTIAITTMFYKQRNEFQKYWDTSIVPRVHTGMVFVNEKKNDVISWYNNQNLPPFGYYNLLMQVKQIPPIQLVRLLAIILGTYLFVRMLVHTVNSQVEPKSKRMSRRKYKAQPSPITNANRPVTRSMTKAK